MLLWGEAASSGLVGLGSLSGSDGSGGLRNPNGLSGLSVLSCASGLSGSGTLSGLSALRAFFCDHCLWCSSSIALSPVVLFLKNLANENQTAGGRKVKVF